jgi:hypothetical protein
MSGCSDYEPWQVTIGPITKPAADFAHAMLIARFLWDHAAPHKPHISKTNASRSTTA